MHTFAPLAVDFCDRNRKKQQPVVEFTPFFTLKNDMINDTFFDRRSTDFGGGKGTNRTKQNQSEVR
jgi:hypothetical protein